MASVCAAFVIAVGPVLDRVGCALVRPVAHHQKKHPKPKPDPPPQYSTGLASWYAQSGTGACNVGQVQSGLRFASLFLRCGQQVQFCNGARCVTATMSDHGPYVSGRLFDLNWNLKQALNCADLCWVKWRLV